MVSVPESWMKKDLGLYEHKQHLAFWKESIYHKDKDRKKAQKSYFQPKQDSEITNYTLKKK